MKEARKAVREEKIGREEGREKEYPKILKPKLNLLNTISQEFQ